MGIRPSSSSAAAVLLLIIAEQTLIPFLSLILLSIGSPFFILGIARCMGTLSASGAANLASKLFPGRSTRLLGIIVAISSLVALAGTPASGPDINHCKKGILHSEKAELNIHLIPDTTTTTTTSTTKLYFTSKPIIITDQPVSVLPNFRKFKHTKSPESVYADSRDWGNIRTLIWPPPTTTLQPPLEPSSFPIPEIHSPYMIPRFRPHKLSSAEIIHRSPWNIQPKPYAPISSRRKIDQRRPIYHWPMENHRIPDAKAHRSNEAKISNSNHPTSILHHPRRFRKSIHYPTRRLLSLDDEDHSMKLSSLNKSLKFLRNLNTSTIAIPVCLVVIVETFLILALEACSSPAWTSNPLAQLIWLITVFPVLLLASSIWPGVCYNFGIPTLHSVVASGTLILALICTFLSGDDESVIFKNPVVGELINGIPPNIRRFPINYHIEQFVSSLAFSILGEFYLIHLALNYDDTFPYNYENLYCGYIAICMLARNGACRIPGVTTLPPWLGLCFVSVHLAVGAWTPKPVALTFLLAPFRGLAEASRIPMKNQNCQFSWNMGYALGCLGGGWLALRFGVSVVLWVGTGIAASCSIGHLIAAWYF